jgi:penicillin-binding protein 2
MYGVVNEGGTGARARVPGIEICGKTGTAQLASNDLLKSLKGDQAMKDNGWFVGFAPRDNPEIVVVALWEGGLHGSTASPIARDVIKAYFDKKANRQPAQLLAQDVGGSRPEGAGASQQP